MKLILYGFLSSEKIEYRPADENLIFRMTKGYIYCVSNPSFKANIYKIGYTTMNLQRRINSLYKTGVPNKFIIHFAKKVNKCRQSEQDIHMKLDKKRINPCREFFNCTLSSIKSLFDEIPGVWWTENTIEKKETQEVTDVRPTRRKLNRKVKKSLLKFNYKG
jgi:hypothetical protein